MHLDVDQLGRYQRRDLPRSELAAIDVHVSGCLYCSRSLADAGAASERWERRGWLARLVRVDEPPKAVTAIDEADEASAARAA